MKNSPDEGERKIGRWERQLDKEYRQSQAGIDGAYFWLERNNFPTRFSDFGGGHMVSRARIGIEARKMDEINHLRNMISMGFPFKQIEFVTFYTNRAVKKMFEKIRENF